MLRAMESVNRGSGEGCQNQRRGRPSLLTASKQRVILSAIERGLSYKQASALAGISYDSFNRWRKQGMSPEATPEIRDFCNQLEASQARGADSLLATINDACKKGSWKAAAWMLERRFPENWDRSRKEDDPLEMFSLRELIR